MADPAATIAIDSSAPAEERYDAQAELTKSSLASQLIPSEDIQPVIDLIRDQWESQELAKAARGNLIVGPWATKPKNRGAQSVILDEFQIQTQGDYWDRPGLLGFDSMRAMVEQTPILNGIVMTRIRQVQRFCRAQAQKADTGFLIKHVDPNMELTDTQRESAKLLQGFVQNCGWEANPRKRKRLGRDSFPMFMAKALRDSLTMDAAPIETEFKRDRGLGLDGFYAVDGATIRLCSERGYEGDDEIYAVQLIQGQIRTAYTYDDLIYEVRNPRTDVTASGYGYSETEMLIRVVTYLLNTMTYNGSFFDKNSIPRGILNLYGNYDQGDIAAFKRYWLAMVRGVNNAHNLPVMVSKDQESKADFVEIGGQMNEMSFGRWLSFLSSLACAIYQMSPEEISMESYSAGRSPMSGSDTEEKLTLSADKGLRPLLNHFEGVLTDFVIHEFSPEYCFRFVGLDDEAQQRQENSKLVLTVNEVRTQLGADPLEGPLGDAPVNPALITVWQQIEGIGQQQEPQGDFGDPDAAGGEGAPPDGGEPSAAKGRDDTPEGNGAGEAEPGAEQPFGTPGDDAEPMGKALTAADFGLPAIHVIED